MPNDKNSKYDLEERTAKFGEILLVLPTKSLKILLQFL